ncbi:MAG: serine/threonine-protein kinase [Acidobacteriota bacterium]
MIPAGKILQSRYRIDKQIGQGGMGSVYVATDERFGSVVAIKETLCMDDNYRRAIEREARLLNSLKHPALPRVSDHFLEDDGQFLVMEYIAGDDLQAILDQNGEPFPIEQVRIWADQLLDALDFLHRQAIPVIHRDIKPQNLKVTGAGQMILLDFGLAKGHVTETGGVAAAKSIFGYSRNYASLEQIQGTGTDPRSDLYSLSATLYHLLTNVPPEDALTRAMNVLGGQPDPLRRADAIRPEIPAGLAATLHQALDLNAVGRPASAADMRKMLKDPESALDLLKTYTEAAPAVAFRGEQATKLMPANTQYAGQRQTNVKTEILPERRSEETVLKQVLPRYRTGQRKVIAALFALAFIAAGVSAYIAGVIPGLEAQPVPQFSDLPLVEETTVNDAPAAPGITESSAENAETSAANSDATAEKPKGDPKKAVRIPVEMRPADRTGTLTVTIGKTKINENRVETPDVTIDSDRITVDEPRLRPPNGPMPPNMRRLTPQQRRRIQIMRRNGVLPPQKP